MPRASRPSYRVPSTYDSFSTQQARMSPADRTRSDAPAAPIAKPYQGLHSAIGHQPLHGVGRYTGGSSVIDNYNQYVRPRLEQAQANRQVDSEIRGLQHTVRNLGRATTSVQGLAIPAVLHELRDVLSGIPAIAEASRIGCRAGGDVPPTAAFQGRHRSTLRHLGPDISALWLGRRLRVDRWLRGWSNPRQSARGPSDPGRGGTAAPLATLRSRRPGPAGRPSDAA